MAIAGVALYVDGSREVPGQGPTYLFAITIGCGVVLVALALIRVVIFSWRSIRRWAMPTRVALAMMGSVPLIAAGGVASLWQRWVPPNYFSYAPSGRRGYEDAMGIAAFGALVATAVIARRLANAESFRGAGLTCCLGAVLAFLLADTRLVFPLWLSESGPVLAGVAAIFLFVTGLALAVFGPTRRSA